MSMIDFFTFTHMATLSKNLNLSETYSWTVKNVNKQLELRVIN